MLGGVKEVNYFIAFEITLMQRAMIQASYIMLTQGRRNRGGWGGYSPPTFH